jgi:hypothetical protein
VTVIRHTQRLFSNNRRSQGKPKRGNDDGRYLAAIDQADDLFARPNSHWLRDLLGFWYFRRPAGRRQVNLMADRKHECKGRC